MKSFIPKIEELQKAELDTFFSKARLYTNEETNEKMLKEARKSMDSLMGSYNKLMSNENVEEEFLADFKTCYQNAVKNLNVNAREILDVPDREECIQRVEKLWNYMGVHTLREDPAQCLSDTLGRNMDDDFDRELREADFSELLHSSEKFKANADQIMKDFDILYRAGVQMPTTEEGRKEVETAVLDIYDQFKKSNCNVEPLAKYSVINSKNLLAYAKACETTICDTLQIDPLWAETEKKNDKPYRDLEDVLMSSLSKGPVQEEKTDEKKTGDVVAEKEVKSTEAKPKEEVKQADQPKISEEKLNQSMNAFEKDVERTQKAIDKAVNGKKAKMSEGDVKAAIEDFYKKLIYDDMQAKKGMLPADKYMQHLQDLQYARDLDAQQNGGFEDYMMEQRADTIQNIGEEYQQNREVTPKLVEKVDALNSIDNVLTSITRNPKLLFITVLLMGLNPFMALGMAVLSAFGNAVVQDLYQKLPETDRNNLENRPAQQPVQEQQPAYNPKIEAYEMEMAKAQQRMKEQEEIIQGLKRDNAETAMLSRRLLSVLGAIKKENSQKARFKEEEQEKKKETEVKKEEKDTEKEKRAEAEKKTETKKKETKETIKQSVLERKDKLTKTRTSVLGG